MLEREILCNDVEQHHVHECTTHTVHIDPTLRLRTQIQRLEINLDQTSEDLKKAQRENSELVHAQKQLIEERDQYEKERNFYKDACYSVSKRFNCKPVTYRTYKVKTMNACNCRS